jgi:hypothetical protein
LTIQVGEDTVEPIRERRAAYGHRSVPLVSGLSAA